MTSEHFFFLNRIDRTFGLSLLTCCKWRDSNNLSRTKILQVNSWYVIQVIRAVDWDRNVKQLKKKLVATSWPFKISFLDMQHS